MSRCKVRFNLGKGENYMKWKVQDANGSRYYSPEEYTLFLVGCTLKSQPAAANKIFQGANKSVCAWVLADKVVLVPTEVIEGLTGNGVRLQYNPRVQPNWLAGDAVVDNQHFGTIYSEGRKLFGIK
jgi:hypothetical protein